MLRVDWRHSKHFFKVVRLLILNDLSESFRELGRALNDSSFDIESGHLLSDFRIDWPIKGGVFLSIIWRLGGIFGADKLFSSLDEFWFFDQISKNQLVTLFKVLHDLGGFALGYWGPLWKPQVMARVKSKVHFLSRPTVRLQISFLTGLVVGGVEIEVLIVLVMAVEFLLSHLVPVLDGSPLFHYF